MQHAMCQRESAIVDILSKDPTKALAYCVLQGGHAASCLNGPQVGTEYGPPENTISAAENIRLPFAQ
eukprot:5229533-Pleurochrysis_carterae.AAC.4